MSISLLDLLYGLMYGTKRVMPFKVAGRGMLPAWSFRKLKERHCFAKVFHWSKYLIKFTCNSDGEMEITGVMGMMHGIGEAVIRGHRSSTLGQDVRERRDRHMRLLARA